LFGPSTVVQEQQASAEATNQPVPVQQSEPEQQSQQEQQSEQGQQSQQEQQSEQEQPAQNSSRPVVEQQAEVSEEKVPTLPDALPDDAADTTNASITADDINSDSKAQEVDPVEKETGSGLFGWLLGSETDKAERPVGTTG